MAPTRHQIIENIRSLHMFAQLYQHNASFRMAWSENFIYMEYFLYFDAHSQRETERLKQA